jgi:hypothetical protein
MDDFMNRLVDKTADFLARRPGFLPLVGLAFIVLNFLLQLFPGSGYWFVDTNLFLHVGLAITIVGLLLIRALG